MTTAVDYAWERPTIQQLQAAGIKDVFRYVGPAEWGKTITQAEYDALVQAGIRVWLVYEGGADDSSGGFDAGVANANTAVQWSPVGYTGPVFMAADEELQGAAFDLGVRYIRGAGTVLTPDRTGVYGEGALIQACVDAGYCKHGWESASSSFPGSGSTVGEAEVQQGFDGPVSGSDADVIVRPIISSPIATSSSPSQGSVFVIPSNTQDKGMFNAWTRLMWGMIRTDPYTAGAQTFFWYFFQLPTTSQAWNVNGWGGNPDSVLSWIIDDASTKGNLRPQWVGAV